MSLQNTSISICSGNITKTRLKGSGWQCLFDVSRKMREVRLRPRTSRAGHQTAHLADGRCCVCEVAATYLVRPAAATLHRSLNCSTALLVPVSSPDIVRNNSGPLICSQKCPPLVSTAVPFRQVVTSAVNEARLRHIVCKYGWTCRS